MCGGEGLPQKERCASLFLARTLVQNQARPVLGFAGLPLSDIAKSLLNLFQPLCQLLRQWIKTPHFVGMATFNLRVKAENLRFSTHLFPKEVTGKRSISIKLYLSTKGTGSWMYFSGKIYNGEKKTFVNKGKMGGHPKSVLFLAPSNLVFVPLQELQLQI